MSKPYPVIRNCNYQTPDNDRAEAVLAALRLVDQGCVDCDLLGAMDDLEQVLSGDNAATEAMAYEEAVADAVHKINGAFHQPRHPKPQSIGDIRSAVSSLRMRLLDVTCSSDDDAVHEAQQYLYIAHALLQQVDCNIILGEYAMRKAVKS
jgi:hypothetical protein